MARYKKRRTNSYRRSRTAQTLRSLGNAKKSRMDTGVRRRSGNGGGKSRVSVSFGRADAGYGGKFRKPVKNVKSFYGSATENGDCVTYEVNKLVKHTEAVYGHAATAPPVALMDAICGAVARRIFKQLLKIDIKDRQAQLTIQAGSFRFLTKNTSNGANGITYTYPFATNTLTFNSLKQAIMQIMWAMAGNGIALAQSLINIDGTGAATAIGVNTTASNEGLNLFKSVSFVGGGTVLYGLPEMDLESLKVAVKTNLTFTVQNVTRAGETGTAAGEAGVDVVNNVPLQGYMYMKNGLNFTYRTQGGIAGSSFQASPVTGVGAVPNAATSSLFELSEPPPPRALFAKKSSRVKIEPGQLKTQKDGFYLKKALNYWISMLTFNTGYTWTATVGYKNVASFDDPLISSRSYLGKVYMFGLEKMTNAADTDRLTVLFESNLQVSAIATGKAKAYLNPNVVILAANETGPVPLPVQPIPS